MLESNPSVGRTEGTMKIADKSLITMLAALAMCAGTALAQGPEDGPPDGIPADASGGVLQRGVPASNLPNHNASSSGNLIDHGGRVLPSSNTYAIWWGTPSTFPSDAEAGIDALLEGLNGTSFLGIADQYMRTAGISSAFHANWTDTS